MVFNEVMDKQDICYQSWSGLTPAVNTSDEVRIDYNNVSQWFVFVGGFRQDRGNGCPQR